MIVGLFNSIGPVKYPVELKLVMLESFNYISCKIFLKDHIC